MVKKIEGPTPELGFPRSKRQLFTYSENKILDQITMEIMEAWAKDLRLMKRAYDKANKSLETIKDIEDRFPALEKFLKKNNFINDLKSIKMSLDAVNSFQGEIHKRLWQLDEKINFSYVQSLMESIKKLETITQTIHAQVQELQNRKTLFQKLCQRFRRLF